MVLIPYLEMQI